MCLSIKLVKIIWAKTFQYLLVVASYFKQQCFTQLLHLNRRHDLIVRTLVLVDWKLPFKCPSLTVMIYLEHYGGIVSVLIHLQLSGAFLWV